MKRNRNLLLLFVLTFLVLVPTLSACNSGVDPLDEFQKEPLEAGDVRVMVVNGEGNLRWAEVDGASGYNLYRSQSRFGVYDRVNAEPLTKTQYKTPDGVYWYYHVKAIVNGSEVDVGETCALSMNTLVVSPDDDMAAVQAYIDEMHGQLESGTDGGQFSDLRLAIILLPGEYPDLSVSLGYYTTLSGAGENPNDVSIGKLYVSNKVLDGETALCTFWRSAENLTIKSDTTWAVSQATSLRRVRIEGDLKLSYSGSSSGGYIANSQITGTIDPGSQQQWFSRNSEWDRWLSASNFNFVFTGCEGYIPTGEWVDVLGVRSTILGTTEKVAEKPFLIYDGSGGYNVFVPDIEQNTEGVTWKDGFGSEAGRLIPLDDFYVANDKLDTADTLNSALADGKHILFTPGHYKLDAPLKVQKADTVLLGIGYATLEITDTNKDCAVSIDEVDGVRFADVLVDAGSYSKNMVVVGKEGSNASHAKNPIVLSNLYFRVGGMENVHTETEAALVIHANDTIGDHFWIWRADHYEGVAWNDTPYNDERGSGIDYGNPAKTGLLVEGDNVSCYALMVEHFEGYQTEWRGENGMTVMYQSETPYYVPNQEAWMSPDGKKGCASYRVDDGVKTHRAYGIGVYLVNFSGVELDSGIEAPETDGIYMEHLLTQRCGSENGSKINNVVNGYGGWVGEGSSRCMIEKFPFDPGKAPGSDVTAPPTPSTPAEDPNSIVQGVKDTGVSADYGSYQYELKMNKDFTFEIRNTAGVAADGTWAYENSVLILFAKIYDVNGNVDASKMIVAAMEDDNFIITIDLSQGDSIFSIEAGVASQFDEAVAAKQPAEQ